MRSKSMPAAARARRHMGTEPGSFAKGIEHAFPSRSSSFLSLWNAQNGVLTGRLVRQSKQLGSVHIWLAQLYFGLEVTMYL